MSMRLIIALAAGVMLLSAVAANFFFGGKSDDPDDILRAKFRAEVQAIKPAADAGDVEAQIALAQLHRGAPMHGGDPTEALRILNALADKGYPQAQTLLGEMYEKAEGTRLDYFKAAEWYTLAAGIGRYPDAQVALGDLYFAGRGVMHSYADAVFWYDRAAKRGHPVAHYLMGIMYTDGWGVKKDPVEAYVQLSLALRQAAKVVAHRNTFDPHGAFAKLKDTMTRAQIDEAERKLAAWKPETK